ncbi:AMP-dependent synthetase/ligase [Amycolatopsis acidicola]|uniref:AMP-dependent synthetase/ligase n=1 Tax=Amycolatopsis acidicola TaxID=2596893 RepID=UPI001FB627E7|nr:AMP-dependent synthetase/ligase [Amycolatopsis acidicola]
METSFPGKGRELAADRGLHSVLAEGNPDGPLFVLEDREVTRREFARHVESVAGELLRRGVRHGDRVAVLGRTGYEWALIDFAALAIGAVVVPVYPTSSAHQIEHVVTDSGAVWFFAETPEDAERFGVENVWLFTGLDGWRAAPGREFAECREVRADDLATIVYTSGTTGLPKGCMLTHANMYASSANTVLRVEPMFEGSTILALPLSHVFGRTILLACVIGRTRTRLVPGVPELLGELAGFQPTFLALVPYALEKIRKLGLNSFGALTDVICGGASLDDTTAEYYAGLGVRILNCYGLTEAATAVTVNAPSTNRPGTVGRPIPGTTVGIAEDGEVLVAGPNVSPGYWPNRAKEQDWLYTGDLGHLDADGYLTITGRRKEILVTNGGKNVAPAPLEDRIRLHPLVSNCMVLGDGRSYITALITVDTDLPHDDPVLLKEIQSAVDSANELVSRAESIRKFRVVHGDFTIADGLLTPSMKLRRAAIGAAYAEDIAALY